MLRAFVTGTDTEVGKTWVTARLLSEARSRGLRTAGFKPVESGVGANDGSDASLLASAAKMPKGSAELYRFEPPIAPGVAAEQVGQTIDFDRIAQRAATLSADTDVFLVEGAGGLLVPLGHARTILDLVEVLALPLLVVARPDLGTINHTSLTIEVARARGIDVLGVVFSQRSADLEPGFLASNATEIRRITGISVLGSAPPIGPIFDRLLADAKPRE